MYEDISMAEKLSAILQIKKLREEQEKLMETAKAEALAKVNEGIEELNILGFNYELVEPGAAKAPRKAGTRKTIDHTPKGACPICTWATTPPHDKRSHRAQAVKKPFTDEELKKLNMVKVAAPVAPTPTPHKPEPEKPKGQAFM
jgi:hypothetical protein